MRKHEAVKTIEIARSQWRGKNAIEQTDPATWKPFVREIVRHRHCLSETGCPVFEQLPVTRSLSAGVSRRAPF